MPPLKHGLLKHTPQPIISNNDNSFDSESSTEAIPSENEASDEERTMIQSDLKSMSFTELMKLKDELGAKIYNEAIFGKSSKTKGKNPKTDFKRANKNRPREMSSKRPVPFLGVEQRLETAATSKISRDPRFDANCGEFDNQIFKANYEFVNEYREKELTRLKKKLKKTVDETKKKEMKLVVQRLENQLREENKRKVKESESRQEQEEIRKAKQEGRTPHYKTKKVRKVTELVKQYEELKTTGKLGKHLEKRRKKNAAKDRKRLDLD